MILPQPVGDTELKGVPDRPPSQLTEAERRIGAPFAPAELLASFQDSGSFSKHLLVAYSLAIGCSARLMAEIGIGASTRALLAAGIETGGRLYSCSADMERYTPLLGLYPVTKRWRLSLTTPNRFIAALPEPLDLVLYRGGIRQAEVLAALLALMPKMRRFGLILMHGTQHPRFGLELTSAIADAGKRHRVSAVTLPFSGGLTVLRVEESSHPAIEPAGRVKGRRVVTVPFSIGPDLAGVVA